MKNFLFLLLVVVLTSCRSSSEQTGAYYSFQNEDSQYLLEDWNVGKKLTFKNHNGDSRIFTVIANNTTKSRVTDGDTFSSERPYFDYDWKKINLKDDASYVSIDIDFQRFPNNEAAALQQFGQKVSSSLIGDLIHLEYNGQDFVLNINFAASGQQMLMNGVSYDNVLIFDSGNNSSTQYKFVKTIYYDKLKGIIGWDEVNGTQWRRIP